MNAYFVEFCVMLWEEKVKFCFNFLYYSLREFFFPKCTFIPHHLAEKLGYMSRFEYDLITKNIKQTKRINFIIFTIIIIIWMPDSWDYNSWGITVPSRTVIKTR